MTQDFDFKIRGESIPIKSGRLIRTADAACDGFTVKTVIDRLTQPELYKAISPYQGPAVTVSLDGRLELTGILTKTGSSNNAGGTTRDLAGWSNTWNFVDSALTPPYELNDSNLHQLTADTAKQTGTRTVFNANEGGQFSKVTISAGQSAFQFLRPLAKQRNQIFSCTADGALLLQQADTTSPPVGTIEEGNPNSLIQKEFQASFDLRKRFRTYKIISQTQAGNGEAVATDENIKFPRHKAINAPDQIPGGTQETANWQKNIALIDAMTMQIPVVGWKAPNGKTWRPDTTITIKSETMFVPDGFTFYIRQVEYVWSGSEKTGILSVIPPNVYTEKDVVEPWFQGQA